MVDRLEQRQEEPAALQAARNTALSQGTDSMVRPPTGKDTSGSFLPIIDVVDPSQAEVRAKAAEKVAAPEADAPKSAPLAKLGHDGDGRIDEITYPDGRIRRFGYNGKETQPNAMTSYDPATQQWSRFVKTGNFEWSQIDANGYTTSKWNGQINISKAGSFSTREGGQDSIADSIWEVHRVDGSHSREKISADGTVSTYDAKNRLIGAHPADDSYKLKAELDKDGHTTAISWHDTKSGETVTWRFGTDGAWHSDSAKYKESRKDLRFDAEGKLGFKDEQDRKSYQKPDGNIISANIDGSQVEKNPAGQIVRTQSRSGDFQTFKYDEAGSLTEITQSKSGKMQTWMAQTDPRQNLKIDANGSVQYDKPDGTKVRIGADLSETRTAANGKLENITFANGASRAFSYDGQGRLRSFTDTLGGLGAESRVWTAQVDGEGRPTGTFSATTADGRKLIRNSVSQSGTTGDIEYKTKDGQQRISKASDMSVMKEKMFPSNDLEEARDSFRAEAQKHGVQMDALNEFIDSFEKRCQDARVAGLKAPSDEQIAKTYDTFRQMLTEPNQAGGFSEQQRAVLVKLAMHNIAYPRRIDQGGSPTCNVTTSEIFTASRHPENYARVMSELSLTGSFQTIGGPRITPPKESLQPGVEEGQFRVENAQQNGYRNWASEIFQSAEVNSVIPFLQPTQWRQVWGQPWVSGNPQMGTDEIQAACKNINGHTMPYFASGHTPSAEELLKLKENGDFPVGVHTIHQQDQNGIVSGMHVQTIHDVRVEGGKVEVLLDNQHGEGNDAGWIDLARLYQTQQLVPSAGIDTVPARFLPRAFAYIRR